MYNLYTKFVKILEICKQFSDNLVNESDFSQAPDFGFCVSQNTYYFGIGYTLSVGYVELSIPMTSQRQVWLISII